MAKSELEQEQQRVKQLEGNVADRDVRALSVCAIISPIRTLRLHLHCLVYWTGANRRAPERHATAAR